MSSSGFGSSSSVADHSKVRYSRLATDDGGYIDLQVKHIVYFCMIKYDKHCVLGSFATVIPTLDIILAVWLSIIQ